MIGKWIVLLNFNIGQRCIGHAASFAALRDVGVFLVDNASSEGDYAELKRASADSAGLLVESNDKAGNQEQIEAYVRDGGRFVVYRNHVNLGWSGGNNTALRSLTPVLGDRGQFLVMNPDVVIANDAALQLLEHEAQICGPAVYEHYMKGISKYGHDVDFATGFGTGRINEPERISCIAGCCFKIAGRALRLYGFLPDENFLYDEEIKYFERVNRLGGSPVYVPEVRIEHIGSLMVRKRSFIYFYYIFRNRLTYFKEIAGPRYGRYARFTGLYASWCLGVAYANLKLRNWDGLRGIARGVWDGLRGLSGPIVR